MQIPKVVIIGKVPPPYLGTSIWFDILRKSTLGSSFNIKWFNVNTHRDFSTLGKGNFRNIWPNIILYFRFLQTLRSFNPALVLIPISQSTPGFLKDSIFVRLARRNGKTLIILHGSNIKNWLNNSPRWVTWYFNNSLKNTCGVIVLGKNLRYLFSDLYSDAKIFVVPNGLKVENLPAKENKRSEVVIRYIGSLTKSKGTIELIEAAKILKESNTEFVMILNGIWRDKEFKDKCMRIIEENTLPVHYCGEVTADEKNKAYSDSDIFVFTPNSPEGHPMIIVEAMASGLPIISTNQGAITESVLDGINGFIVKPDSPAEIAEKVRFLINNPEVRISMGVESRRLYLENFTEEKMVDRLKNVFNKVLQEV